ncbi:MAG TPA: hypothetical protein VGS19_38390 [Streptosporangiaceae bacterium]|nr:hypothetical protein [Streptosporangiaceae bacterium]
MTATTPTTDQLEALRQAHGQRWQFWAVPRVVGGTLWCARLYADQTVVVQRRSAVELSRAVTEWDGAR